MTDALCFACDNASMQMDLILECSTCGNVYHAGCCSDVTERSIRSKSQSFKKNWKCTDCLTNNSPHAVDEKKEQSLNIEGKFALINAKLEKLLLLQTSVVEIGQSVQHMSDKFDEIMARLDRQDADIKAVKKRVDKIENSRIIDTQRQLQETVNDLEWRSRQFNLEFHGIPLTANENPLEKVNELAPLLDLPSLTPSDISAIHRLPARPQKIPGIIVRYNRKDVRDMWFEKRKALRGKAADAFILENMTRHNRELLRITKDWAAINHFRFAWHTNGKILLRKETGSPIITVKSEAHLSTLLD